VSAPGDRDGFSIVELIIALVILTVGMLALAAGSGYTTVEVRTSALRTQRTAAVASVVEQLRSRAFDTVAFDSLHALARSSAQKVGSDSVWYDLAADQVVGGVTYTRKVTVYAKGPRYQPHGGWTSTSVDTFVTVIFRPIR
jgi:prepilin-type N-terminal cleavage/methylation domain-containing protein